VIPLNVKCLIRTPPPVVDKDQSLSLVLDMMEKHGLGSIGVVDDGKPVGIVSLKNVLNRIWSERVRSVSLNNLYVSSAMESTPLASSSISILDACKLMVEKRISALPILEDDELLGMLFEEDIPRLLLDWDSKDYSFLLDELISVKPSDSLLHARMLMLRKDLQILPVTSENYKFIGVISDWNIIKVIRIVQEKVSYKYKDTRMRNLFVSDAFTPSPPTLTGNPSIAEISRTLLSSNLRGIVILDEERKVKMIIQLRDMPRILIRRGKTVGNC